MFRLLNKSAIWHLCQCVNHWLWNSSKLPFTSAVLQSASPSNPPACPPAMVGPGYAGSWSVSQSVVSNFPRYSGAEIHSLGRRAFQAVGSLNAPSLWAYLVDALYKYFCNSDFLPYKQCAIAHMLATTPADIYKCRYWNRNTCAHIDRYRPTDKNPIL